MQRTESSVTKEEVLAALEQGQLQILLDGFDEVDPDIKRSFEIQLNDFVDTYKNCQYVISARECPEMHSTDQFTVFYILPFDKEQILLLAHKLLSNENSSYQNKVAEALTRGLRSHHEGITTNPMLITYFIENYRRIMRYHRMDFRLNREIYDILLFGHDELKKFFSRKFQSVSSPNVFTTVFRKFCAMTYLDRIFELGPNEFDKYFT